MCVSSSDLWFVKLDWEGYVGSRPRGGGNDYADRSMWSGALMEFISKNCESHVIALIYSVLKLHVWKKIYPIPPRLGL